MKNDEIEKILKSFDQLQLLCRKIKSKVQKSNDPSSKEISSTLDLVMQACTSVRVNLTRLLESSVKRSQLIDIQILEETFEGELHDNYHQVLDQIETELNNLYLSIKTLTNRIPDLVAAFLGHDKSRSIKTGSFGKFVNSLEKYPTDDPQLTKTIKEIFKLCKRIKETHNSYRDRFVEHTKPSNFSSALRSVGVSSVVREHYKGIVKSPSEKVKTIKGKPHWTKFFVPGGYFYYIHISLSEKMKGGYKFKKGEAIGEMYDSDTRHFKKYSPHMHVFRSRSIPDMPPPFPIEETEYSPEPIFITNEVVSAVIRILNLMKDTKRD